MVSGCTPEIQVYCSTLSSAARPRAPAFLPPAAGERSSESDKSYNKKDSAVRLTRSSYASAPTLDDLPLPRELL